MEPGCDVLVVGGGAAGRAAARAARRAAGPRAAIVLLEPAPGPGWAGRRVEVVAGVAWGAFPPREVAAAVEGRPCVFRPARLVLAEPPVALPVAIPGWALPGVYRLDQPIPRQGPLLLAGGGTGLVRHALRLLRAGHQLRAVALDHPPRDRRDRVHVARLRRAGVEVLLDATPHRCRGHARFEALEIGARRIEAAHCVLHGGWAPETGLARALGVPHRVAAPGVLVPLLAADGSTGVPGVTMVACTAPALARAAPAQAFADTDVVCPCEGVTAAAVRDALRDGAASVPGVKRATRAGMGACQGRLCAPTLHAFCGAGGAESRHAAPRAPVRPVRIGAIMHPATPHAAPIAIPAASRWRVAPPAAPPADAGIVVVGGGVIGLAAARALAQAGRDVLVLDENEPGLAASTANAGSLHVQLVPHDVLAGFPGPMGEALSLGPASIALWQEIALAAGEPLGLRIEGGIVLANDAADLAALARKAAYERARGVDTRILGPAELAALAPALARIYPGAAFCAQEGQIDPLRGTAALLRLARAAGVRLAPGARVVALAREGSGWRIETPQGAVRAGMVLNAAGAHAGSVARLADIALPLRALVQQVVATAPAPPLLRQLVAQAGTHLSLKQGAGGHLLVGGGWPGRLGADGATRLERRSIEGNLWTASRALPALADAVAVRAWTGLAVHLDRAPILAASPGQEGLFHAVTANGYTLAPIIGAMMAEAMMGRTTLPAAFALAD